MFENWNVRSEDQKLEMLKTEVIKISKEQDYKTRLDELKTLLDSLGGKIAIAEIALRALARITLRQGSVTQGEISKSVHKVAGVSPEGSAAEQLIWQALDQS